MNKAVSFFLLITVASTSTTNSLWADEGKAKGKAKTSETDTMDLKMTFQRKVEAELRGTKGTIADTKAAIRYAPHHNHRKIEFVIEKMEKEFACAQKDLDQLTSAGDFEWKAFEPKLNEALKNLKQYTQEVKPLLKPEK